MSQPLLVRTMASGSSPEERGSVPLQEKRVSLPLPAPQQTKGADNGFAVAFDLGYVRFPLATPRNRTTLFSFADPMVIAGAEMPDGKLIAFTYIVNSSDMIEMQKMVRLDPATGAFSDIAQLTPDFPTLLDATYEPVSGTLLALAVWSGDSRPSLVKIDAATGALTRIRVLDNIWYSLAADGQGRVFFVEQHDGTLGVLTQPLSGAEPVAVGRGNASGASYVSSLSMDRDAYRLYWARCGSDGRAHLIDINPLSGSSTDLGTVGVAGAAKELMAFNIPALAKNAGVPEAPTELTVVPGEKGALTAKVSWKNPQADSTLLYLNGKLMHNFGATVAGTPATMELKGLTQGYNHVRVVGENSAGTGHYADQYFFVGRDVPCAVTGLKVRRQAPDTAVLTWTAPTQSVHGGYVSPTNIKYRITRYSMGGDTTVVQKTFRGTSYSEKVTKSNTYYYTVQSLSTDYGMTATSDTVYLGPALSLPYDCSFATLDDYSLWTPHSANGNRRAWTYFSSTPQHIYNPPFNQGNDDWLFSAPMSLEKGKEYYLYMLVRSGLGTYYPKMIDIAAGKEATAEGQTITIGRDTIASRVNEEWRYTFSVPESGEYHISLHDKSPFVSCNFYVYRIALREKTQGRITGHVTDAENRPVQGAEISIDRTTLKGISGADGSYLIDYVEPGTYSMTCSKAGYAPCSTQSPVDVTERNATVVDLRLTALPSSTLRGTVTDSYGNALEGATIKLNGEGLKYEAVSDAQGAYTFGGVTRGQYTVRVEKLRFTPWNGNVDLTADASLPVKMEALHIAPHDIKVTLGENNTTVNWQKPRAMFRRDNGVAKSQNGAVVGNDYYVFGHVWKRPATISAITWMTTDYRGPHNEMNLWVFAINPDGTPSNQVLYNAMHVPAQGDLKWNRHELPEPVNCPDGFYLAVSYSHGMASIAMSDGEDAVWPFVEGVNYRSKDYRTNEWTCVDASFVRNTYMLRAEGEGIGESVPAYPYRYMLYRLPEGAENDSVSWRQLTPQEGITDLTFTDDLKGVTDGNYRYAIRALYPGNVLSESIFSQVYFLHNGVASIGIDGFMPWPNPVSAQLNLGAVCDKAELFDLTGTRRLEIRNTDIMDVSDLAPGYYLLRAVKGDRQSVVRIIKK